MQRPLSWQGWSRRPWVKLLSGTMYAPSTADRGAELWIKAVSAEAFRAKTSVWQGPEQGSTDSDRGSGASMRELYATYSPATSSWKMSQLSLLGDSTVSSATWPKSGSIRSSSMYLRPKRQARPTVAKGSSYSRNEYPTPSATPYGTSQNEGKVAHKRPTAGTPGLETWAKNWPTAGANYWKGSFQPGQRRGQLYEAAEQKWATPTAHDGRRPGADVHSTQGNNLSRDTANWATPTAGDAKQSGAAGYPTDSKRNAGTTLTDMVSGPRGPLGRKTKTAGEPTSQPEVRRLLSPNFVEALMGFPVGWSFAQIVSDASETQSSPKQQSLRGAR